MPEWFFGVGCSPILDGDRLIVLVGGQPNAGVVAFNTKDGRVLWQAVGRDTWNGVVDAHADEPYEWTGEEKIVSYSSPLIAEIHGKRHLLCLMRQGLVSLYPETGALNQPTSSVAQFCRRRQPHASMRQQTRVCSVMANSFSDDVSFDHVVIRRT